MSVLPERFRHIVVEGPIGAGKTSLARRIANASGASLMLEAPDENPFLPKFYRDMVRYALPTQLFFLFQRIHQLAELKQQDLFKGVTIGDFLIEKDPLFARMILSDDELALYEQMYRHLKPQAVVPDLVIYLQAHPDTLVERVKRRGAAYEQPISEAYLIKLAERYTRFFHHYEAAPLLIVNADHFNFVDGDEDFALLMKHVREFRGKREYLNRIE
jgi:deoxyadenosine/deoxycytidine kinase